MTSSRTFLSWLFDKEEQARALAASNPKGRSVLGEGGKETEGGKEGEVKGGTPSQDARYHSAVGEESRHANHAVAPSLMPRELEARSRQTGQFIQWVDIGGFDSDLVGIIAK